ncbi:MAG: uroporphyrinogen-III synthase [Phycisphaerae bacterium]
MNVWVTRDETADGPLCRALRGHGLTPVAVPVLRRRVVSDLHDELRQLEPSDWLVFTSAFAAEALRSDTATHCRVAVVGQATRTAAERSGWRVTLVGRGPGAEGLFAELRTRVTSGTVLYARSSRANVPEAWDGVRLLCPVCYDIVTCEFDRRLIETVEAVALASPSAAAAIADAGVDLSELRLASIGPTTSAALRRLGVEPWVQADDTTLESLAAAIAAAARVVEAGE